jgi:hypothetical protein
LVVFGIAVLIITPLWGLLTGGAAAGVLNVAWVAFVIVIYPAVLIPGFIFFAHNPAWWIPGGLAAAAPFYLGACWERRR